ncbi:MAG: VOC family protein [Chloroflexota bacterium]
MIIAPNHTSFTVSDMDRSLAFYRDLLGFELVNDRLATSDFAGKMSGIPGAELRVVYVQAAGYRLELIQYLKAEGEPMDPRTNRPGSAHLCFNVDNVDETYALLTSHGVKAKAPPMVIPGGPNQNGRGFYFTDPDGFTIEFIQPPA